MGLNIENQLEDYKVRLDIALKAANVCVFEVDLPNQLYTVFENSQAIFGVDGETILNDVRQYSQLSPEEYQNAVSQYFSHPDDYNVIDQAFQMIFSGQSTSYEARMRAGHSEFKWCKIDVTPLLDNGIPIKMIGVITDIDEIKRKNLSLQSALMYDGFTGLYNKNASIELIEKSLKSYPNQNHALIALDIDNFKRINDTYGHLIGDEMILQLANKLRITFQSNDIIGRFGGDEFILFIQDISNHQDLKERLESLLLCQKNQITCSNSMGIALYPQDAKTFESLLQKADQALYHAKHTKECYCFYQTIHENKK